MSNLKSINLSDTSFFTLWVFNHQANIKKVMKDYDLDPENMQQFMDISIYIYENDPESVEDNHN
jgi:hypothetical protein